MIELTKGGAGWFIQLKMLKIQKREVKSEEHIVNIVIV